MKVISKIPGGRYLVSIKEDELANVLGEYSSSSLKSDFLNQVMKEETEIPISDIYQKHRLIVSVQNESDYSTARTKLQQMLNALTPIESKINMLTQNKSKE